MPDGKSDINTVVILRTPTDILAEAWVKMIVSREMFFMDDISEDNDMENWMQWHDAAIACLDADKAGTIEMAARRAEALLERDYPYIEMGAGDFLSSMTGIASNHITGQDSDIDISPEILYLPFRGDADEAADILDRISELPVSGYRMHSVALLSDADALALGPREYRNILNCGLGSSDNPLPFMQAEGMQNPGFALLIMEPVAVNDNDEIRVPDIIRNMLDGFNTHDIAWESPIHPAELASYTECRNELPHSFRDELLHYAAMAVEEGGPGTSAIIVPSSGGAMAEVRMISPAGYVLDNLSFPCPAAGPEAMAAMLSELDMAVTMNCHSPSIHEAIRPVRRPSGQGLRVIPGGKI